MNRYSCCHITWCDIFYQGIWEILKINVLLESLILAVCVIWGISKCEEKESRKWFVQWWLSDFIKSISKSVFWGKLIYSDNNHYIH